MKRTGPYGFSCSGGCCVGNGWMTHAGFVACPSGDHVPNHHAVIGAGRQNVMGVGGFMATPTSRARYLPSSPPIIIFQHHFFPTSSNIISQQHFPTSFSITSFSNIIEQPYAQCSTYPSPLSHSVSVCALAGWGASPPAGSTAATRTAYRAATVTADPRPTPTKARPVAMTATPALRAERKRSVCQCVHTIVVVSETQIWQHARHFYIPVYFVEHEET